MKSLSSILINGPHPYSLVNFRGDLIRDLIALGYEVHVSTPDGDGGTDEQFDARTRERLDALAALGVRSHSLPLERAGLNPVSDFRYLASMLALQRKIRPALVINYTIKPNIWGSFAARLLGIPAVSMVTGVGYMMIEAAGVKRRLVQGFARRLYAAALSSNRAVVFQNGDDVADFVKARIVAPSKVRMVRGSGVNLDHFAPAPLPQAPIFLMISRLLVTKGVREYAAAAEAVRQQYPEARFLLVGGAGSGPDGIPEEEAAQWTAVERVGLKSDVRQSIAEAAVYVLPSYREGTPRSVLEAMAMGRPVITTDVPGCRETVRDGENGILVPARDAEALRDAMIRLIEDKGAREHMAQASLRMVRELFDVRKVNQDLLRHFGLDR